MATNGLSPDANPINERGQFVPRHVDLAIGATFGRLTVLGGELRAGKQYMVSCRCDCGKEIRCRVDSLRIGKKLQCGDHARVITDEMRRCLGLRTRTHGCSGTTEYNSWISMKMRCFNPKDGRYDSYGGRGITIAPEWIEDFESFLAFMGHKPSPAHSLDRIDNDGNYEPGNVRWATRIEQSRNRRPFLMTMKPSATVQPPRPQTPPERNLRRGINSRHGYSGTPEYGAWHAMKGRCHCPTHHAYARYGGRGIRVCPEWHASFEAFLRDVGLKPDRSFSLDRINPDGDYEPGNVRWADRSTQNRNRRPFMIYPGSRSA
jgi:hypothetical protein